MKLLTLAPALWEPGDRGDEALGMTVGEAANGGDEPVVITRRKAR